MKAIRRRTISERETADMTTCRATRKQTFMARQKVAVHSVSRESVLPAAVIQKERPYGRSFYFSKFLVDYSALLTSRSCDFCSIWLR